MTNRIDRAIADAERILDRKDPDPRYPGLSALGKAIEAAREGAESFIAHPDGRLEYLKKLPTLDEAQKIVGGYVEMVFPRTTPNVIFLCDEDGRRKQYPVNPLGSILYGVGNAPIVGTIIVMTRTAARKGGWL